MVTKWYTEKTYVDQASGEILKVWQVIKDYDIIHTETKIENHGTYNIKKIYNYCERKRQLTIW